MKEIITGDGRIFRETDHGDYQEIGGKQVRVTARDIANYERYSGDKLESLKESHKKHPRFTEMMIQKSKL